ncbi:MAG: hypothetical protein FJZ38_07995 [Candidatus Rokubacteria bacterium]|nr:hypothetical protein [Candidatus Rokubacteria bacterium]
MPVPLVLTCISTVAFAIQLLIFAYLYSSHRLRFFRYLLFGWGAYGLSKGLRVVDVVIFGLEDPSVATGVATVAAVGFILAAALAHGWDYRLRRSDVLIGGALALVLALVTTLGRGSEGLQVVGAALGIVQIAAGALFWPWRTQESRGRVRGERLLAGLLVLWGLHRVWTQFVDAPPGSAAYFTMHGVFITLYFLSTFAVIIMVLEHARRESERLHARLSEAERLATTGELAAGMAHEIRNPLAAIVNATALLTDEAGLTTEERAATVGAIRSSRAPRVDVKVAVDPAVPRFPFERDQVTQVLWNVALNGVQAMNGRGRLSFEVGREDGHVGLAVSDTGPGIPADVLARVFEPFYSGKPNGSGLGLTIAERIVAAHGGRIDIASEPGRGTRVTMRFPVEAA